MLTKLSIAVVFYLVVCIQGQTTENNVNLDEACTPVPGLFIQNQTRKIECCDAIIEELYQLWSAQRVYLSKTLATLKSWNCPQLDQFCSNRFLDFTEYTALVYDRFCDEAQILRTCESVISRAIPAIGKLAFDAFRAKVYDVYWTKLLV